jgi:hypothetical protein
VIEEGSPSFRIVWRGQEGFVVLAGVEQLERFDTLEEAETYIRSHYAEALRRARLWFATWSSSSERHVTPEVIDALERLQWDRSWLPPLIAEVGMGPDRTGHLRGCGRSRGEVPHQTGRGRGQRAPIAVGGPMRTVLTVLWAWFSLSVPVGLVIGKAIRFGMSGGPSWRS